MRRRRRASPMFFRPNIYRCRHGVRRVAGVRYPLLAGCRHGHVFAAARVCRSCREPTRSPPCSLHKETTMFLPDYRLEYIFSYTAHTRLPPEIVGPVPDGVRAYVYVIRGEAHGPKVKGTFTPDRAEEVLVRKDGIVILDVR